METVLEIKGLKKSYGKKAALDIGNLEFKGGKIIGLLGPNGSGKTTFIKLVSGLLTPTLGEIKVGGMLVGADTKSIVSYLPDANYLFDWMKTKDVIAFFKDFYKDFDEGLALSMLSNLGIDLKQSLKSMSKGTKEKVQLILVMSRRAKLYLLDEPIGGVDPAARDYILKTIISNYNEEAVVVIATHLIGDVENILDDFIFIDEGKVVLAGSVDEVREEKGKSIDNLFREVFKC
ncbi:MAG: ABC transporter ATP-binding protein [Firmicutes bacterium]|nr:ABC transporter ATP-binding protein [Bacillota bacterium]